MGSGCGDVAVAGEGTNVATGGVLVLGGPSVPSAFRRLVSSATSVSFSLLLLLLQLLQVLVQVKRALSDILHGSEKATDPART